MGLGRWLCKEPQQVYNVAILYTGLCIEWISRGYRSSIIQVSRRYHSENAHSNRPHGAEDGGSGKRAKEADGVLHLSAAGAIESTTRGFRVVMHPHRDHPHGCRCS